jgi:hypothetical protein
MTVFLKQYGEKRTGTNYIPRHLFAQRMAVARDKNAKRS